MGRLDRRGLDRQSRLVSGSDPNTVSEPVQTWATEEALLGIEVPQATNEEGIDLSQIRSLKALTATEWVQSLVTIVRNMQRYRASIRTV